MRKGGRWRGEGGEGWARGFPVSEVVSGYTNSVCVGMELSFKQS